MNLIDLAGKYTGEVSWSDSNGESGSLTEATVLRLDGGSFLVDHEDGSSLRLDPADGVHGLYTIRRDAVEVAGRAFLTDGSLVLDYMAVVKDGTQENITDVWRRDGSSITRIGLIRQSSRAIWFEAGMSRVD